MTTIIKKPENDLENRLMELVNEHNDKYYDIRDHTQENKDLILEGANNVISINNYIATRLNVNTQKLTAAELIRNKENIVDENKNRLIQE